MCLLSFQQCLRCRFHESAMHHVSSLSFLFFFYFRWDGSSAFVKISSWWIQKSTVTDFRKMRAAHLFFSFFLFSLSMNCFTLFSLFSELVDGTKYVSELHKIWSASAAQAHRKRSASTAIAQRKRSDRAAIAQCKRSASPA